MSHISLLLFLQNFFFFLENAKEEILFYVIRKKKTTNQTNMILLDMTINRITEPLKSTEKHSSTGTFIKTRESCF